MGRDFTCQPFSLWTTHSTTWVTVKQQKTQPGVDTVDSWLEPWEDDYLTEAVWENPLDKAVQSFLLLFFLFWKAGLITVWHWAPTALLAFTDGLCWSHIIKTVWFTPKTHYFITRSLRSVWLAAMAQLMANLTVHYFISLVCFPSRKTLFVRLKRTFRALWCQERKPFKYSHARWSQVVLHLLPLQQLCIVLEFYSILSFVRK